jgi:hypothetical protein
MSERRGPASDHGFESTRAGAARQDRGQRQTGVRGRPYQRFRRAGMHHPPTFIAAFGAQVDDPIVQALSALPAAFANLLSILSMIHGCRFKSSARSFRRIALRTAMEPT